MKAVILAGGLGTRLNEETKDMPKPMVRIGGKPILLHIMNLYSSFGINEFIICCGYKGYVIKEYFNNYFLHNSDIEMEIDTGIIKHKNNNNHNNWKILFADTGEQTMTGGRIKKVKRYLKNENFFLMTYGDGLSDVNIKKLINFHKRKNKIATLTAVYPSPRFGVLGINNGIVNSFKEKVVRKGLRINGGFFVLNKEIFNYIKNDKTIFETEVLTKLVNKNELAAYNHNGFWEPMDTPRDKKYLDDLWNSNNAPWRIE